MDGVGEGIINKEQIISVYMEEEATKELIKAHIGTCISTDFGHLGQHLRQHGRKEPFGEQEQLQYQEVVPMVIN